MLQVELLLKLLHKLRSTEAFECRPIPRKSKLTTRWVWRKAPLTALQADQVGSIWRLIRGVALEPTKRTGFKVIDSLTHPFPNISHGLSGPSIPYRLILFCSMRDFFKRKRTISTNHFTLPIASHRFEVIFSFSLEIGLIFAQFDLSF